ncbi:alkanesulfonate monooxygenase SsuD/methylene tetrahydromethanopterin reductase-like flavin-dependent oxidoreductase (luciferase family) [Kineococcus xinjiangensis]|uniref:Alkanesulfonate monooxygenase SsuD/methylene tetrahydromethanopterin reductase-like flavin-dependent oxidoreductase (Luciferase family) n=1 Tax=Kineococcus xinjiangensis TaxID=512762 RepID=A0A2S6IDP5_9ACTN|nr:LLM class flavin-dependent oxidoreductase [Kineococcus xinjiangensis]PPK92344.1 alkanesulfonate monooxygenase SsuD/methylene tetrahydromethanopterin reductase-like flavin-dependent oxidoreductase (luciferase family) [Kineococcus xinjiangensis]
MTTLGAVFLPQLPPERLRAVAGAADAAGLEELWLWEDCFLESGIAPAAAALAWTERLSVGIGLLPVPLRNVALTAMELATLHRMFPGRLHAGLGHGVQDWMGQVGARVESPLTLLREHVTALRSLLSGEETSTSGRYVHLDRVRLGWPPASAPALHVGGQGPRTLRLCGEVGDGTLLTSELGPEGIRRACALVEEGRRAAGATGAHRITVQLLTATGPGAAERLAGSMRSWGIDPASGAGIAGDAEAVADAVRACTGAGADAVVLQPTADDPDPAGFVRFAAEEVRPLLG